MNWLKNLKTKNLISLSVGLAFLTLSFTGLMLYFLPHTPTTSLTHTIFGFTFLLAAIFHIRNNWISLKTYWSIKTSSKLINAFASNYCLVEPWSFSFC
jgi:hypothetical protein